MTRRDYALIAESLAYSLCKLQDAYEPAEPFYHGLVQDLATALESTDPRFNRAKFISACLGE